MTPEQRAESELAAGEMSEAIAHLIAGLIVVEPMLNEPYRDDPRWSPWSRFVGPYLAAASKARRRWIESLR